MVAGYSVFLMRKWMRSKQIGILIDTLSTSAGTEKNDSGVGLEYYGRRCRVDDGRMEAETPMHAAY